MQSDDLIKKLLRSAAICEALFFGLTFISFLLSAPLMMLFNTGSRVDISFGQTFGAFLPEIIRVILITVAFFGIWNCFNKAVDPQKYSGVNRYLLIALIVGGTIVGYVVNLTFNVNVSRLYSVDLYAKMAMFRYYITIIGYLNSAAIVLMWIVLGMQWYRDRLIKEQKALEKAAQENGEQKTEPAADASADPGWDSYRDRLVKEQAEAAPPQEYIFNNKQ